MPAILTNYDYRHGMPANCSDAIRILRRMGFAVAVLKPDVVGKPLNRSRVEQSMIQEGTRRSAELSHMNYGSTR